MDNHTLRWFSSSPLLIGAHSGYDAKAFLFPLHFNIQEKVDNTCQCACTIMDTEMTFVWDALNLEQAKEQCQIIVNKFCYYLWTAGDEH